MLDPHHTTAASRPDNTATRERQSGPTRGARANAADQPPQELLDAVLAQDRQLIEQIIHAPNLRVLIYKLADATRRYEDRTITGLEGLLECGDALMNYVNSIPLVRELDMSQLLRTGLIAIQDYNAGSDAKLRALRGKPPNTTKAKRPSAARVRALIRLFVHVLMSGGKQNGGLEEMEEIEAERQVAKYATANGLKRTQLGVRGICSDIDTVTDKEAADLFETLKARLPTEARHRSLEQRQAWVKGQSTILRKLI